MASSSSDHRPDGREKLASTHAILSASYPEEPLLYPSPPTPDQFTFVRHVDSEKILAASRSRE